MKHLYVRKFSSLIGNIQRVLLVFILFSNLYVIAQNYPMQESLSSVNYEPYQTFTGQAPGYLEVNTNQFGNEVIRISDVDAFGTDWQNLRHRYSLDQPWNSDGSLIKLAGYPAAILDGETNEFLYWANIPSSALWSNSDPNTMYGVSGNSIVSYNVTTNSRETLHTFSEFSYIKYGYGKGNTSFDDKYMGVIGRNGDDQTLIVYDIEEDVVVGTHFIGTRNMMWFTVSPTGLYAVEHYAPNGSGEEQGIKVYDIDLTNYRHLNDYTSHADLGLNEDGEDVYVAFGDETTRPNDYYMKTVRLRDGLVTPIFYYPEDTGVWSGHISCRNNSRPGWAYVSEGCCETVGKREVFAIKLDGSDMIERFTIHHTNEDSGYGHEAHAVPNRDGSKVMFASNYDDTFTGDYAPAFIVQAPNSSLSVENESINENQIKVYPNPSRDGLVNIKLNGNIAVKSIQLFDMLGRAIRTEEMDTNEKSLNLSTLPQGVYLLSFQTENNGSVTKRIILN
ncbi:T9SS type A sorting domain-containing protein [Xanthomarina spongicola]|uniref:Putative secreted protein (Por secretion system target) n=1 Tax=Xanthomarina spongicola TaxID=570520 RepID=A0A316DQ95_9FLAO|nr:T9SS type A sorting domain-containing protein [Xanthomarina spongicola]PWK19956.1 putative secreted protein (Por secretion system target) [Xanthomarina spongicola]